MEGFLLLLVNEAVGDEVVEKRAEASPASLCCVGREQGGAPELYRAAPHSSNFLKHSSLSEDKK